MNYSNDPVTAQATQWLTQLDHALTHADIPTALALFADECYWRDLLAFTWSIVTMENHAEIRDMLAATLATTQPAKWTLTEPATEKDGVVEGWFSFETAVGRGRGIFRLKDGRCWTLLTTLQELNGYEEQAGPRRVMGGEYGVVKGRQTWLEKRQSEEARLGYSEQPYCVIIGGGQGGIALGARLKRLGVPTLILDQHERPGDAWRKRYKSLYLHDPVWFDHLPYIPFPDHWPVFAHKDKIADWLEMYTKVMELNYWSSTVCRHAAYDEATQEWTVTVERDGESVVLKPKQLVLATGGALSSPRTPAIPGAEKFAGAQFHSSRFYSGAGWTGKQCIVLGTGTSAHDICADLWEHGAHVTMIQRSSTTVVRSESLMELGIGRLYSEAALAAGITTERADLIDASMPFALKHIGGQALTRQLKQRDADFYARLAAAGFQLDFGVDGSGQGMKAIRNGGGFYIDVGASELIISGAIRLRSGVGIERIQEQSVVLTDGSKLPADLIIYATGYGAANEGIAKLISQEVADKVGKVWGLGSDTHGDPGPWEGELRNMWKPLQQPGLWIHGGNLAWSRFYSLYVALQIKARKEGLSTPVYRLAPVHHAQ
ncbi:MAG: NAD(P)/FAD-dependent oxidoreductase [Caldilineaceae bacterium]|nr:NAD(P)/FAD-dependent oxidoreductase [Caldilineaceae bacterium]